MKYGKLLFSLLATGCLSSTAHADISIAIVGPMTGPNASFGEQLKSGAIAAAEVINSHGGVLGEKIRIVPEDDVCDPRQAVSVANKVIADGIGFVAGHFCSGATLPASEVYEEAGVVSITFSTNPDITERGFQRIFRISGRDDQQGPVAASYILKNFRNEKLAILDDKTPFGAGLARLVKQATEQGGLKSVLEISVNAGEKDFSAVLTRLKDAGVSVVYFGGYHTEAGLLLRQAQDMGMQISLVGADPLSSSEFVTIAGAAANGASYTFGADPRKNPAASEAIAQLKADGKDADGWSIYSYSVVQTFASAIVKAGTTAPEAVAASLRSASYETALGNVRFNEKGDNEAPGFVVYQWKDGKSSYADEIE